MSTGLYLSKVFDDAWSSLAVDSVAMMMAMRDRLAPSTTFELGVRTKLRGAERQGLGFNLSKEGKTSAIRNIQR